MPLLVVALLVGFAHHVARSTGARRADLALVASVAVLVAAAGDPATAGIALLAVVVGDAAPVALAHR